MILAWASPLNSASRALSSKILWPTKIYLSRQKQRYCSKCGAAIEWCWASFIFCGNPTIRLTLYKSGTGYSLHQAPETPDNTIHWPNADVMLGHCLRRLADIIPIKTLYGLITIFNHEHLSEHFLKTKVGLPNLGTPNVILDIFTRTGVHKCQPFLTHSTPISPK